MIYCYQYIKSTVSLDDTILPSNETHSIDRGQLLLSSMLCAHNLETISITHRSLLYTES